MKPVFKSLVVAGLLASAGFAAFSQNTSPVSGHRSMMDDSSTMAYGGHGFERHMDPAKMEAAYAKRSAELKARLKITPEQEGAWTAFTTAMKPPAKATYQRPDRAELDKLSTPERIDKMHSLRTQRLADMNTAMDQRDDATKTFYAALNAEQKKIFDSEHARMGARHRGDHDHAWGSQDKDGKPAAKAVKPAQPAPKQ